MSSAATSPSDPALIRRSFSVAGFVRGEKVKSGGALLHVTFLPKKPPSRVEGT
jgi:hypothetical protein